MATNVFDLAATLTLDSKDYEKGLDRNEKKANSFASKVGTGLKVAGAAGVAAVGAATTAVVALSKAAVDGYADYEQLVGGVETLFGSSAAKKVLADAENAYKTAGMSVNEYMETSIQSAASLINSLGGDQKKAAELMNMSITDMSDNVNKMGTSMEGVQNAYRGFSRGNFTMLDNLALGFAGTKDGMQELLNKAEEISGFKYDISSYSDIVEAIHVVQTEMGITGTTAEEASKTISGSLASAKSAWSNLLVAFGRGNKETKKATKAFVSSLVTAAKNIVPAVSQALMGIAEFVKDIAPEITKHLPGLVSELLPKVLKTAMTLLSGIRSTVLSWTSSIFKVVTDAVSKINWKELGTTIIDGIKDGWGDMAQWASTTFGAIGDAVSTIDWEQLGKDVFNAITGAFDNLLGFFTGDDGKFTEAKDGIADIDWKELGKTIWGAIKGVFDGVSTFYVGVFKAAKKKVGEIDWKTVGTTIWGAIKGAFSAIGTWFKNKFDAAKEKIGEVDWLGIGKTIWNTIVKGIGDVVDWASKKFTEAKEAIGEVDWEQLGKDVWNAIVKAFENIVDFFTGEDGVFTKVKNSIGNGTDIDWKGLGESIWGFIKEAFSAVTGFFLGVFKEARETIKKIKWKELGGVIWGFIKSAFLSIASWFQTKFEEAKEWVSTKVNWIALGQAIWDGIIKAIKDAAGWFYNLFFGSEGDTNSVYGKVKGINWVKLGISIWDGIKQAIKDAAGWFYDIFFGSGEKDTKGVFGKVGTINWANLGSTIWNGITGTIKDAGSWFYGTFFSDAGSVFNELTGITWSDIGDNIWDGITGFVGNISSWVDDYIGDDSVFGSLMYELSNVDWGNIGIDLWDGITGGLSSAWGTFTYWLDNAINNYTPPTIWVDVKTKSTIHVGDDGRYYGGKNRKFKKGYLNPLEFKEPTQIGNSIFGDGAGSEIVMSDRRLKELTGGSGRNIYNTPVEINVYPQPNQDPREVAEMVQREFVRWDNQRKAAYV